MTTQTVNGSTLICSTLERLGVECVLGLPGSQNLELYEALRRSSLRTILSTHELAASFMANGYFRSSGKMGVITAIPGPGFTYALTGLAEAYLDSAAVLCLVVKPADSPGHRFQLQAIDQSSMASPIVKKIFCVERFSDLRSLLVEAFLQAKDGEPGPVLVQVEGSLLSEVGPDTPADFSSIALKKAAPEPAEVEEIVKWLCEAKRVVLYLGAGANEAARDVREWAELLKTPVLTTTSGRGILPEDHPLAFPSDTGAETTQTINSLIHASDLLLALGCKFSHNGARGFRLKIPKEKLIHVDASSEVLEANYPAQISLVCDAGVFLASLRPFKNRIQASGTGWTEDELRSWRQQIRNEVAERNCEPSIPDIPSAAPAALFEALSQTLPADSCVVTDSGLHQMLARKYFCVKSPRGFLVPADFQSMGFGLPAAIGAKLASPEKTIVAVLGDGAFLMSAMEMITAVREKLSLTLLLFNDGKLGLIRWGQLESFGHSHATDLQNPDFAVFAKAVGANYFKMTGDPAVVFRKCFKTPGVNLVEVRLEDSFEFHKMHAKSFIKGTLRDLIGPALVGKIRNRKKSNVR